MAMKKRFITGVVYVIVVAGLLVMKLLIPTAADGVDYGALGIDLLFLAVSAIGSFELTRAFGVKPKSVALHKAEDNSSADIAGANKEAAANTGVISRAQRLVTIVTCSLMIPAFVLGKIVAIKRGIFIPGGVALVLMLAVGSLGAMVVASLTVFDHERSDLKSTAYCELCILYCGALGSVGANVNHLMDNSEVAVLMLFITTPFVDAGAFFVGKLFGKLLPLKLAPHTSPNKTVVGAVGGLLGGILAGVIVWVISEFTAVAPFVYAGSLPKWLLLMIFAVPVSILAQLGDLFESAVKRGCGIKDMGKLLPGHGGMLDRFDSMLFASVAIVVCLMLI